MRKLIGPLVLVLLLVIAYFLVRNFVRVPLSAIKPEFDTVRRGDLIVPITASGSIRPASVTNIKSEASGEVILLPFELDQYVKKGDLIVQLDETDESRNVQRATAEYQRAVVAYEQAGIRRLEAEQVGIPMAEAKVAQAEAQERLAELEFEHIKKVRATDPGYGSDQEFLMREAKYKQTMAATKATKAELAQATLNIKMTDKEILAAKQVQESAQRAKEEAAAAVDDDANWSGESNA